MRKCKRMCAFVRVRCQGRRKQSHSANINLSTNARYMSTAAQTIFLTMAGDAEKLELLNMWAFRISWRIWTCTFYALEKTWQRTAPHRCSPTYCHYDLRKLQLNVCNYRISIHNPYEFKMFGFCKHKHYVYVWLPRAFKAPCSFCCSVLIVLSLSSAVSEPDTIGACIVGFRKCYLQENVNCARKRNLIASWKMVFWFAYKK